MFCFLMIIRYVGLLDVFLFFDDVICFCSKVSDSLNLNMAAAIKAGEDQSSGCQRGRVLYPPDLIPTN